MAANRFNGQSILLVTGRLAEPAIRAMQESLQEKFSIQLHIQVLPITVAALMSPQWIARKIEIPDDCDVILLPGYCDGDLSPLQEITGKPIEVGPRDLRRLPEFFGGRLEPVELNDHSIEIIAEINHAPRMSVKQIIDSAIRMREQGADVIDIGCEPQVVWSEVGTVVRELVDRGLRISIDSLNPLEIAPAVAAGASLVLSVNSSNQAEAVDWGCEVVAIPDTPEDWKQISKTVDFLAGANVPFRIDPILEPIGFGFAASLHRYMEARKMWPDTSMMMGIGNITELTDVDSAGVNFLLLAICHELQIQSVLTTQVINWARSSVRECDIARRMVHYSLNAGVPPKNLDSRLVSLRDPRLQPIDTEQLATLAKQIKDNNYRVFADQENIHLLGSGQHWTDEDAFELFQQLLQSNPTNVDASHAFYLGYEMCKATIANQLGKNYTQDESLRWGHLTVEEVSHRRLKREKSKKKIHEKSDEQKPG